MLGALLRLAYQTIAERMTAWLADAGHSALQPSHSAAIQSLWAKPDGVRLTAMAQNAHVTKQTMGALVDHLERHRYVERIADPDDGRASRIRLTKKGEAFAKEARAFSRRTEAELDTLLGPRRVDELRTALRMIHEEFRSGDE